MGKIDELIKQFCPDGVQKVPLGDVLDYEQPSKYIVKSTEYDNSYNIPVLTAGKGFLLGYTNEQTGVYAASKENPTIIFDDFVTSFHWVDFPFKVKSSAMKMLTCKDKGNSFRFIYYAMCEIGFVAKEHSRHWISVYSKIEVPLPPLAVQKEIVEILDTFTGMIANLQEELEQRQKQFEYYRNQLLVFKDGKIKNITIGKVGDIGKICMCKRIMKSQTNTVCGIPFYKIGTFGKDADAYISKDVFEEYKKLYSYPKKGDVLMSASGTIGRTVVFDGKPSYFQDSNIVWVDNNEKKVLNSYLKYYYQIAKWETQGGTIKRLYNSLLASTEIIYPSLDKQQEIVDKLDTFEALISNIKQEIELRQKQYEYYREKLLTFE